MLIPHTSSIADNLTIAITVIISFCCIIYKCYRVNTIEEPTYPLRMYDVATKRFVWCIDTSQENKENDQTILKGESQTDVSGF